MIMHRVKEPEEEIRTAEERSQQDMEECTKIFTSLMMEEARNDIKLCRRIGERGQDPRPMVVDLRTEATKSKILEMAKNLRDTEYKEVGIVPDLTVQQRREESQMTEEVERMNEEELSDEDRAKNLKWLVVGPRGAKKIIKGVEREQYMQRRGARGRRSGARGGSSRGTGVNRMPLRPGSPRQLGAGCSVRLEAQLLPSTRQVTSKRKEMETAAEVEEGMEEETTSPARKK